MTKQQIITEAEDWLRMPNRAVELYKQGEPTFEVYATSQQDLDRFRSVLMTIPDPELLALVKLEGHNSPIFMAINNDMNDCWDEFEELRERLIERELHNRIKFCSSKLARGTIITRTWLLFAYWSTETGNPELLMSF